MDIRSECMLRPYDTEGNNQVQVSSVLVNDFLYKVALKCNSILSAPAPLGPVIEQSEIA